MSGSTEVGERSLCLVIEVYLTNRTKELTYSSVATLTEELYILCILYQLDIIYTKYILHLYTKYILYHIIYYVFI